MSLYNHRKNEFSNFFYKKKGQNVTVRNIVPMQQDWLMLGTTEGILLFDEMCIRDRFRVMVFVHTFVTEILSDFVYTLKTAYDKSLQVKLGGDTQVEPSSLQSAFSDELYTHYRRHIPDYVYPSSRYTLLHILPSERQSE